MHVCVCVLRVNMCDYVLQVPCSHFGDESEQPNEYFGLKIFFFPSSVASYEFCHPL